MTQHTVGFIGFGNMAQAMAKGFLQAGVLEGAQIAACAKRWEKLEKTAGELGVIPCKDAVEVLERSDILILAVKPYLIETALFNRNSARPHPGEAGRQGAALCGGGLALPAV